jgi:hypothetical protein
MFRGPPGKERRKFLFRLRHIVNVFLHAAGFQTSSRLAVVRCRTAVAHHKKRDIV